jgi:DNA-binding CsgD family transcriptional regulator
LRQTPTRDTPLDTPSPSATALELRAEAERLLRDGLSGYDIALALNIDVEALRHLLGFCVDCQ